MIHVAKSDNVAEFSGVAAIAVAFAAHADARDTNTIICAEDPPNVRESETGGAEGNGGSAEKLTTVQLVFGCVCLHRSILLLDAREALRI